MGSAVTVMAALVGMWVALDPWPKVGWVTPNQHDADFAEAVGEMKEFRDEWKCDEYDEELAELMEKQKHGDTSIDTQRKIEKLRKKMEKLECDRFEDFG